METRNLDDECEREAFARRAAAYFDSDVHCTTYTDDGYVEAGQLFAVRWGLDGDCILVFRLHEFEPVLNYHNIGRRIRRDDSGRYVYVDSTK